MNGSGQKGKGKKKANEIKTFPVPFALGEIKTNITINPNTPSKPSKEQLINQAFKFHSQGNISEAAKCYKYLIKQGCNDYRIYTNYAGTLKNLGKLKDAELSSCKAILLNPNIDVLHSNLGRILIDLGKLQEAKISYLKAIELNPNSAKAHCDLGIILKDLGNLKEAEIYTLKAIELNPNLAEAHSNLGSILMDHGKLKEAKISYMKAIKLNPNLTKAYFNISLIKFSDNNKVWLNQLFSENILNNKSPKDKVDIYFARANILHKNKNYKESANCLELANKLKLGIKPSKPNIYINKSRRLLIESNKNIHNQKILDINAESIFIVGMPRSGSSLLESILSMNIDVNDLGEINILEESFLELKEKDQKFSLSELYWKKINNYNNIIKITTNKWLFNYLYAGIILTQIPNSKIIHCFRNPLDNILSIYRAHFANGNEYSSSLVDTAKIYLNQEEVMTEYKNRFRSKIYDLNYDLLVSNPNQEIKSLISWLGWEWDDSYLTPHLNPRSVSTASNVQVRSPINSKSIGGWKNYKDMLKPAIEILNTTDKYRDITSKTKLKKLGKILRATSQNLRRYVSVHGF